MTLETLEQKLEGIHELIETKLTNNEKEHASILTQVTRTNGRVTRLEKWRYTIGGALIIITFFLSFISVKIVFNFN